MSMAKLHLLPFCALMCLAVGCGATMYMVGDSSGWDISTDLDSWARDKRFIVGDVLLFQYSSYHSVCELTEEEYKGCNTTNALLKSTSGNATFSLTEPGDRYFACGNRLHCLGGMKLHAHVEPNSTNTAPIGAPKAAPGLASSLPGTSKSGNPSFPSSAELIKLSEPFFLCLLGFVGYLIS